MAFEINRVDVWAGDVDDRPGGLARKLESVMRSGADLDFMIVRRKPEKSGEAVLFLAPLVGDKQTEAATDGGMHKAAGLHTIRLEGPNRPGLAAGISETVAKAGISMRGLSAAAIGGRCVFYLAFETDEDAVAATQVLTSALG